MNKKQICKSACFVYCTLFAMAGTSLVSAPAYALDGKVPLGVAKVSASPVNDGSADTMTLAVSAPSNEPFDAENDPEKLEVQAVLTAKSNVVVAGLMDGVLTSYPYDNGDTFKKGAVLAKFDCRFEEGKSQEIESRLRSSARQLKAYDRLKGKDAVAEIDYFSAFEDHQQLKALLKQAKSKLDLCVIKAPFDGRVTDSAASNHESVRSGRVLMQISSIDSLQAEVMVPSVWLKWLVPGTSLSVFVHEKGKSYHAKVIRIHGQVDPVTRTIQVVAEIEGVTDDLLPGMSGNAVFTKPK